MAPVWANFHLRSWLHWNKFNLTRLLVDVLRALIGSSHSPVAALGHKKFGSSEKACLMSVCQVLDVFSLILILKWSEILSWCSEFSANWLGYFNLRAHVSTTLCNYLVQICLNHYTPKCPWKIIYSLSEEHFFVR